MKEFSLEELEHIETLALTQARQAQHPLWKHSLLNLATSASFLMFLKKNSCDEIQFDKYSSSNKDYENT